VTPLYVDTIFALASGAGRAGVAVIRLSGPQAGPALEKLSGQPLPKPRQAFRARFMDPVDGDIIDDGLALWFPAPASFTGEDVVEIHVHGGMAVRTALFGALSAFGGLRMADPGEFTRRAFENGKMDLTEAEGLADLIDAETQAQRRQARRQHDGELGRLYEAWRARLVRAQAMMEAEIDFSDEDLQTDVIRHAFREAADLDAEIAEHLNDSRRGERMRDGFYVAIIGPPNAGKSSLLNLLAQRDAAIVSDIAGTTRDIIEVHLDLGGYPLIIADTAGLNESADRIENEGIRRAKERAENADLKLAVFDTVQFCGDGGPDPLTAALVDKRTLIVVNKRDQFDGPLPARPFSVNEDERPVFPISVKTGTGVDALIQEMERQAAKGLGGSEGLGPTRERHRRALEECRDALARILVSPEQLPEPEFFGEDLRLAARSLGRITGRIGVEDILDVIFREFCIGK